MVSWTAEEEVSALNHVKTSGCRSSYRSIKAWQTYAVTRDQKYPKRKAQSIMEHVRTLMSHPENHRYLVTDLQLLTIDDMEEIYTK